MKEFTNFYKLYGPVFVVCYVGIGAMTFGSLIGLTMLVGSDAIIKYIPDMIVSFAGESAMSAASGAGKFVVAYGIYKVLIPFRIAGAIWLTRKLSPRFKRT